MSLVTNFKQANQALAVFIPNTRTDGNYTLDRQIALMEYLGNPQNQLKVIHVAGTSGKTSTCYYVASLLQTAGLKVGLTVSPHIMEVNERVQINLVPLAESEFCQELSQFLGLIKASQLKLSYFEVLVAFAYWEFAKQQVDYAVIEVGLGGLLDGTNVINRPDKVCILTDIGLDHTKILGSTLAEIAGQKAGIIRPHNIAFCYRQGDEVMQVFQHQADKMEAKLEVIEPTDKYSPELDFLPMFQKRNFTLAAAAVKYLLRRDGLAPLKPSQFLTAAHTAIPGRMEIFTYKDKDIILDGAHNGQKLETLIKSIAAKYPDQPVAAIASFSALGADERLEPGLKALKPIVEYILITEFGNDQDYHQRSVASERMAAATKAMAIPCKVIKEPKAALKALVNRPEKVLLITGSLYLLATFRNLVQELTT